MRERVVGFHRGRGRFFPHSLGVGLRSAFGVGLISLCIDRHNAHAGLRAPFEDQVATRIAVPFDSFHAL